MDLSDEDPNEIEFFPAADAFESAGSARAARLSRGCYQGTRGMSEVFVGGIRWEQTSGEPEMGQWEMVDEGQAIFRLGASTMGGIVSYR
jgi:hypothetical protein